MPQFYQWYYPQRVVYVRFPIVTDYEFLKRANEELLEFLRDADKLTHILADARFIEDAPTNLIKIRQASPAFNSNKVGWALLVSENPLYRFLGATVPQIVTRQRTRAYATVEEALDFLHSREPDLDWSQANDDLLNA